MEIASTSPKVGLRGQFFRLYQNMFILATNNAEDNTTIERLRSSNCNPDTIDGLPSWMVVEKQEYDLPKQVIEQIESLLQNLKQWYNSKCYN